MNEDETVAETPNNETLETELATDAPEALRHSWEGILVVMGVKTGDGRRIEPGALTNRDLPLPLMVQFSNPETGGHAGAVLAGNITEIRYEDDTVIGRGLFDIGEEGQKAFQMASDGMLKGISVDLDSFKAELIESGEDSYVNIVGARIMGATLTPFPAFAEAGITLVADGQDADEQGVLFEDTEIGIRVISPTKWLSLEDVDDDSDNTTEAFTVKNSEQFATISYPVEPPAWWFDDPKMEKVQPVTVDADGRVFGYIATWGSCHISFKGKCTDVPRCGSYKMFMNKTVLCKDGEVRPCGVLFANTTHADKFAKADAAADHYANTGAAMADVAVYEDDKGLVIAGAVRPDIPSHFVRVLRGSDVSPDWRNVRSKKNPKGKMELVALLAVNTSGFLVESLLASGEEYTFEDVDGIRAGYDDGDVVSLVAAGMVHKVTENERIAELEKTVAEMASTLHRVDEYVKAVELADLHYREELAAKEAERQMAELAGRFTSL